MGLLQGFAGHSAGTAEDVRSERRQSGIECFSAFPDQPEFLLVVPVPGLSGIGSEDLSGVLSVEAYWQACFRMRAFLPAWLKDRRRGWGERQAS